MPIRLVVLPGDALVTDVKAGKTFFRDSKAAEKTGTMPTKAIVAAAETYEEGYHAGNPGGLSAIEADLAPANIKEAVNLFGKVGTLESVPAIIASETLRNSNDDVRTKVSSVMTKIKETKLNEAFVGVMRIKFEAKDGEYSNAKIRIYRNGSPIGTEHTMSQNFVTWSEDFTDLNWAANDLIQLYCRWTSESGTTSAQNFRFYYDYDLTPISTTNQDP